MKTINKTTKLLIAIGLGTAMTLSCKKEVSQTEVKNNKEKSSSASVLWDNTTSYTWSVAPTTYTNTQFETDHGGVNSKSGIWPTSRCKIENETFVIKLEANKYGKDGGLVSYAKAVDSPHATIQFDIKFSDGFDFSKGGKTGFGLGVGTVATGDSVGGMTGVQRAKNGLGASFRLMWNNVNGQIKFKPYAYYKNMGTEAGENFVYPTNGSIQAGVWYTVNMKLRMNATDADSSKGSYSMEIWERGTNANYQKMERTDIHWADGTNKKITQLMCDNFRGGNDTSWNSQYNGYVFLDNTKIDYIWQ